MKLCAVYVCWDDWELLGYSLKNMEPLVDGFIIVGSIKSNHGEYSPVPSEYYKRPDFFVHEPRFAHPMHSETDKRNYGLDLARKQGYTHFISCDSDEFYNAKEFNVAKQGIIDLDLKGLVCPLKVLFKTERLYVDDITLVPFIHKLTPTIRHDFNKTYPFAWSGKQIRIDPTRSFNINSGVNYTDKVTMYHASWIRRDYEKKIRNSTARRNLERSTILNDLAYAKEGGFCHFYGQTLRRSEVSFGIPEMS